MSDASSPEGPSFPTPSTVSSPACLSECFIAAYQVLQEEAGDLMTAILEKQTRLSKVRAAISAFEKLIPTPSTGTS